jgi:CBS domain-containing protein
MKARELMRRFPEVVTPGDGVTCAAELMHYGHDACIPVVRDEKSRVLMGVITARDIAVRCVARRHALTCRVADHMTPMPLHTIDSERDAADAAAMMDEWDVRRIPVVTADGMLLGVLEEGELRRALRDRASSLTSATRNPHPNSLFLDTQSP